MAGRIFVTGDCHGSFGKLNEYSFPLQGELDKDDYLIVCGDFGLIWDYRGENRRESRWLQWLEEKNFTILFVDGNHENFERLAEYPVEIWNGGKVHKIGPSVYHLMRGQIFHLNGKSIFTMGGASSHDIDAGILEPYDPEFDEKRKKLDNEYALYRVNHISWWKEELPCKEEYREAVENLEEAGYRVDYIISHCCATSTQNHLPKGKYYDADELTDFLDCVKKEVKFDKWYFGHYHTDYQAGENEVLLYDDILEIGENLEKIAIRDGISYEDYVRAVKRMYEQDRDGYDSLKEYARGDKVVFQYYTEEKIMFGMGTIAGIDALGGGIWSAYRIPSFDILSEMGDGCLFKHIPICVVGKCYKDGEKDTISDGEVKEQADVLYNDTSLHVGDGK